MNETILNSKYIEKIAKQICIIDHEILSSLNYSDFTQYITKKESLKSFDKFKIREKLLQCYILFLIIMHNNLENKKNVVKNFISSSYIKNLNNQKTCNTIISAFNIGGFTKKNLLWKLIEKK